jgi:hypothetical protein
VEYAHGLYKAASLRKLCWRRHLPSFPVERTNIFHKLLLLLRGQSQWNDEAGRLAWAFTLSRLERGGLEHIMCPTTPWLSIRWLAFLLLRFGTESCWRL